MALTQEQINQIRAQDKLPPVGSTTDTVDRSSELEAAWGAPKKTIGSRISDTANKTGKIVNSVFPGKQVGESIGTLAGYGVTAAKEKLGLAPKGSTEQYDLSAPNPIQVLGDVAQGALTVAAPGATAETVGGRIATNAAIGAGLGGTGAVSEGKGLKDIAKDALIGGAIGGGVSAVGEGINALAKNLPKWLTKAALPKLKGENVDYALENTKVGKISTLAKSSKDSIKNYESQVQSILSHPEFKAVAENTDKILEDSLQTFPNSSYDKSTFIKNAKKIAPEVSKLIDKMDAGQADIQELNTIRKALDKATSSVYTSLNRPPESKALGAALSNGIREYVKTEAPETVAIFENFAKEIDLQKALASVAKKADGANYKDVLAGVGGFAHSGLKGALTAILLERGVTNPAVQMAAAKGIQAASKAAPAVSAITKSVRSPVIKKITSKKQSEE